MIQFLILIHQGVTSACKIIFSNKDDDTLSSHIPTLNISTFPTVAKAHGADDKAIMAMGGWSTDAVMKTVYQQSMQETRDQAETVLNDYYEEMLK